MRPRRRGHESCATCDMYAEINDWGPPVGNRLKHNAIDRRSWNDGRDPARRRQLPGTDGAGEGEATPDVPAADE